VTIRSINTQIKNDNPITKNNVNTEIIANMPIIRFKDFIIQRDIKQSFEQNLIKILILVNMGNFEDLHILKANLNLS